MKRMRLFIVIMLSLVAPSFYAQSYNQFGYVKTKGSKEKIGDRIDAVKIKIKGKHMVFQSDSRGEFTIGGIDRKFVLERIEKKGYELLDYETTGTDIEVTSEPLRIVMVSKDQLRLESNAIYKELIKHIEKYKSESNQLRLDVSNLEEALRKMADRLARVDYDLMSEKDREIRQCLENGDLHKADSLILSKGTIEERMEYSNKGQKSLLDDCYILATNAILRNEVDSALVLLENRTEIDPQNINCLLDAGDAYLNYQTNTSEALDYYRQALFFSEKKFGEDHALTINCKVRVANAHFLQREMNEAIPILHDCLGAYKTPNIPIIYERTDIDFLEESNVSGIDVVEPEDSANVGHLYSMATIIYAVQGNFDLAWKCYNLSDLYSTDAESRLFQINSLASVLIAAGECKSALENAILPLLKEVEGEPCNIVIANFYSLASMCYLQLGDIDSSIMYSDKILNYFDAIKQRNNQSYYLALLVKSSSLIAKEEFDLADDIIVKSEQMIESDGTLPLDVYVQLLMNKATILTHKAYLLKNNGYFHRAKDVLLHSFGLINESSEEKQFDYRRIKGLIAMLLGEIYMKIDDMENAKTCMDFAFVQFTDLYKSINYDHNDMIHILVKLAELETSVEDYLEAFRSYRMRYKIRESSKCIKHIKECYKLASQNKKYRKTKEFKTLKKEYKEFISIIPETNESDNVTN